MGEIDRRPSVEEFRSETVEFLREAVATGIACPAYGAILPPAAHEPAMRWQRYCYEHGFAGVHWPTEYGGRGLDPAHNVVWHEECARADVAPYLNLQGLVLAGQSILRSGTEAQKQRFLRPTLSNEILWCQLFSEPGAGSDLAGLASSAVRDGDHFVLNGQKVWSSNAQLAQFGILMARTDPSLPKHRGISFFLLDMALAGIEVRPLKQMTADEEFCEVFFDDVLVPEDALLGELNGGWSVAMSVLIDERGGAGAASVINMDRRLERLASTAPSLDPVERGRLTELLSRGTSLRSLMASRAGDPAMAPITKLMQSDMGYDEALLAAGLRGAEAMLWDEFAEPLLYAPGMRIAGGSSEIQRNIIGERLLGLPKEPVV